MKPTAIPFSLSAVARYVLFAAVAAAWVPVYGQRGASGQKQHEFAMLAAPYHGLLLHFGVGVNLPSRKNLYTNISFGMTTTDGPGRMRLTLSSGLKYELLFGDFYLAGGCNAGIFHTGRDNGSLITHTYGLCAIPSLETGARTKRMIVAAGVYSMIGYGFYREFMGGSPYHGSSAAGEFRDDRVVVPYIRLILENRSRRISGRPAG